MRRTALLLLCIALAFAPLHASANSGPVYWKGYPSAEVLAVEQDCPVQVLQEHLTFDLSGGTQGGYGLRGLVTAEYLMHNPGKRRSVQMAFPLVTSLDSFDPASIHISQDGEPLPFELYIGQAYPQAYTAPGAGEPAEESFSDYLSHIQKEPYAPARFSLTGRATLYTFQAEKTGAQDIRLSITFEPSDAIYLSDGMSSYGMNADGSVHFGSWAHGHEQFSILAIGAPAAYSVAAYTDADSRPAPADAYRYEVTTREVVTGDYLRALSTRLIRENFPAAALENAQMEEQLYALALRSLDAQIGEQRAFSEFTLIEPFFGPYLLILLYEAPFPAGGDSRLSIRYPVESTMDSRDTITPLYSFSYIFSPAAHWASFGDLYIAVQAPAEAPYVVDSTLPFAQDGALRYAAHSERLPGEPLRFSLYSNPTVTVLDMAASSLKHSLGYAWPLALGLAVLAALLLAVFLVLALRKRRKKAGDP